MVRSGGRIGVIYPSDGVLDHEFWRCVPDDVSVHVTRSLSSANLDPSLSPAQKHVVMAESTDVEDAARSFSLIEAGCVAYACTAASFTCGVGYDSEIIKRIEAVSGSPAGVQRLDAKRVCQEAILPKIVTDWVDILLPICFENSFTFI